MALRREKSEISEAIQISITKAEMPGIMMRRCRDLFDALAQNEMELELYRIKMPYAARARGIDPQSALMRESQLLKFAEELRALSSTRSVERLITLANQMEVMRRLQVNALTALIQAEWAIKSDRWAPGKAGSAK